MSRARSIRVGYDAICNFLADPTLIPMNVFNRYPTGTVGHRAVQAATDVIRDLQARLPGWSSLALAHRNQVIAQQRAEIDRLQHEVADLNNQLAKALSDLETAKANSSNAVKEEPVEDVVKEEPVEQTV